MRIVLSILFVFLMGTPLLFGQKIKVKKDMVYLDGKEQFRMESLQLGNTINIYNLKGDKLIVLKAHTYRDKSAVSAGNPDGNIRYFDVTFLNETLDKCEIPMMLKKGLAGEIISSNLLDNDVLNEKAVKQFITINGTKFSDERNRSTTIIIQHN